MIILMLCWVAQPEYELHIFLTLVILDLKLWWRHKKRGSWRWAPFALLHTCTCIILHRTALWNEAEWKLVMRSLLCTYCASCIQCAWWPCCRCRCTLSGKYRPIREHALLLTLHKMQQSLTEKMHNCTSTLKLHNGYTLIRNALHSVHCAIAQLFESKVRKLQCVAQWNLWAHSLAQQPLIRRHPLHHLYDTRSPKVFSHLAAQSVVYGNKFILNSWCLWKSINGATSFFDIIKQHLPRESNFMCFWLLLTPVF